MAKITVTEILGTDNVGLSRPVINENFKITKDAINKLESFLDTTPINGELTVGKVTIESASGNENETSLTVASSGLFAGNLVVNKQFSVNPSTTGGVASFQVDGSGNVHFNGGISMDLLSKPVTPGTNPISTDVLNVLNLDLGSPGIAAPDVTLGDGFEGQVLMLRFKEAGSGTFKIQGNIVGTPGILTIDGAKINDTLTLGFLNGWVVLNKYGDTLTIS